MLTINADEHELMSQFHKPTDEKRMVVILLSGDYDGWLNAPPAQTHEFLRQYPADRLVAIPAPG